MAVEFRYLTITVERAAQRDLRAHLGGSGRQAVEAAGGVLWGVWSGQGSIGWRSDQMVAVTAWADAAAITGEDPLLHGAPGVDGLRAERLYATARPDRAEALEGGGVIAHRWFELADHDWDEFLELSTGAWPAFEETYEATIHGFLRSRDVASPSARVLLVTRYASLAEWERSRETATAADGKAAEAGQRFIRRAALTSSTIVRVAPTLVLS